MTYAVRKKLGPRIADKEGFGTSTTLPHPLRAPVSHRFKKPFPTFYPGSEKSKLLHRRHLPRVLWELPLPIKLKACRTALRRPPRRAIHLALQVPHATVEIRRLGPPGKHKIVLSRNRPTQIPHLPTKRSKFSHMLYNFVHDFTIPFSRFRMDCVHKYLWFERALVHFGLPMKRK